MFEAVAALVARARRRSRSSSPTPAVARRPGQAAELNKRYAELAPIVAAYHAWHAAPDDLEAARELAAEDPALRRGGARRWRRPLHAAEERLRRLLVPRDPDDDQDVILEIKAGEGGEESALFAGDLLRMYLRYAERRGWKTEILDATESDLGGYKDVQVAVKAKGTPRARARRRGPG